MKIKIMTIIKSIQRRKTKVKDELFKKKIAETQYQTIEERKQSERLSSGI